jgi:hypothetical protein
VIAATGTVAEWAVGVGTLALAAATGWLALKAKGQVKVAAEHVVAIQRPLVAPVVTPEWDHLGRTQSRIVLKNVGLGPAYDFTGGLFWTGGFRRGLGPADGEARTRRADRNAGRGGGHQHQLGRGEGLSALPRLWRSRVGDAPSLPVGPRATIPQPFPLAYRPSSPLALAI